MVNVARQPLVAGPWGVTFFWPQGERLGVREGDAVFGVWHDRSVAGGFPLTSLLCTDRDCAMQLWHMSDDGRSWVDEHVRGIHFAHLRDTGVPGTTTAP